MRIIVWCKSFLHSSIDELHESYLPTIPLNSSLIASIGSHQIAWFHLMMSVLKWAHHDRWRCPLPKPSSYWLWNIILLLLSGCLAVCHSSYLGWVPWVYTNSCLLGYSPQHCLSILCRRTRVKDQFSNYLCFGTLVFSNPTLHIAAMNDVWRAFSVCSLIQSGVTESPRES